MSLFEDDIQLNEHQVAWYSKDWTAVQSAADSFKEKAENEFLKDKIEKILGKIY